ncbi:uncharacterized protein LOC144446039 [Glandiceps talaboti]
MAPPSEDVYRAAVFRRKRTNVRVNDIRGSPKSLACCGCTLSIIAIIFLFIGVALTIVGYLEYPDDKRFTAFRIVGPIFMGLFALNLFLGLFMCKAAKIQAERWKAAESEGKIPQAANVTTNETGTLTISGTPGGIQKCGYAMIVVGVVFLLAGIPLTIVGIINGPSQIPWIFFIIWGPICCVASIGFFLGGWGVFKCAKIQEERLKHPEEYTAQLRPRTQPTTVSGQMEGPFSTATQSTFGIPRRDINEIPEQTQYSGHYTYN